MTGAAKYIALVAMGYSSLSHGAKDDGVLDSQKRFSKRGALTARSPAYARRAGQRAGEAKQKQLDVATIAPAQLSTKLVARIATALERQLAVPSLLLSENGGNGWHCGVESIQTPPSSSYFSGDKFNIALG